MTTAPVAHTINAYKISLPLKNDALGKDTYLAESTTTTLSVCPFILKT